MNRRTCSATAPSAAARTSRPSFARPKLEDMSATAQNYIGSDWVTSDIRLTTDAGQTPIAPGARVSDVTQQRPPHGALRQHRADPQLLLDPVGRLSGRLDRSTTASSCRSIYHPGHDWNVAEDAARDGRRARLLPGALRALSVQLRPDHRVPGLQRASPRPLPAPCPIRNRSASTPRPTIRRRSTSPPMSSPTRCRTNIGRTR